jgi:hypothetical protein
MAKSSASDSIMAPNEMKPLLAVSKREPVQAAIALTNDGDGVILLHKRAKPKKVLAMLKAEAGRVKLTLNNASMRFGRAFVDSDYDAGMVRFFINKDAPGNMRAKLVEVVKRIPYQKVELNIDPSLEDEPEDEAQELVVAPPAAPESQTPPPAPEPPPVSLDAAALRGDLAGLIGRIAQAAGADAERKAGLAALAGEANAALKASDAAAAADAIARLRAALDADQPPPPPEIGLDAEAMRKQLLVLVGRIAQVAGDDAARKATLAKLAGDANASLKATALPEAAKAIEALRIALDVTAAAPAPAPASGDDPVGIWWDTKDKVNEQIERLRHVFLATGHALAQAACEKGLGAFSGGMLTRFQAAIIDYNQAATTARPDKSQRVRQLGDALTKFISGNATLPILEKNPFGVPVTIRRDVLNAVDKIVAGLA